jgi:hypothetical protein
MLSPMKSISFWVFSLPGILLVTWIRYGLEKTSRRPSNRKKLMIKSRNRGFSRRPLRSAITWLGGFSPTKTMRPAGYILPPVRVTPFRTRKERERDRVLGRHHLGVVYPISKAETFLKEDKRKAREEERRRKMEEKRMERMEVANTAKKAETTNSGSPKSTSRSFKVSVHFVS